jgi:cobalamin biosynthesis Mg chelatase CobN
MPKRLMIYALIAVLMALTTHFALAQEATSVPTEEPSTTEEAVTPQEAAATEEKAATQEADTIGEAGVESEGSVGEEAQTASDNQSVEESAEDEGTVDLSTLMFVVGLVTVGGVGVLMIRRNTEEDAA